MKRKHQQKSPRSGCQIISKFFKTSSVQDVKEAANLRNNTDSNTASKVPIIHLTEPVLQKLTKLRECLSRGTFIKNPPSISEDEKQKMEGNNFVPDSDRPIDQKQNVEIKSTACTSKDNVEVSCPSRNDLPDVFKSSELTETRVDSHDDSLATFENPDVVTPKSRSISITELSCEDDLDNTQPMDISFEHPLFSLELEECEEKPHEPSPSPRRPNSLDIELSCDKKDNIQTLSTSRFEPPLQEQDDFEESPTVLLAENTDAVDNTTDIVIVDTEDSTTESISPINFHNYFNDSETTFDSQGSQNINQLETDSDDDLLEAPSFLYEKKQTKPEVRTPEKISLPIGASPVVSPVKAGRHFKQEFMKEKKYTYSLEKMLKEKLKEDVKNEKLSEMEAELDAGIEEGGIKAIPDVISEDETDSEVDDGRDLSKCKLPSNVSKYLVQVSDFSEDLVGEDIFPELDNRILDNKLPHLNFLSPDHNDEFVRNLISTQPCEVKEVLCGGWLLQYYLKRPCPAPIAEWVFSIMCCYPDTFLSSKCYQTLWALLRAGNEEQNGIPKGIRGMTWVPSVKNILHVLQSYGATSESLVPIELQSTGILLMVDEFIKNELKPQDFTRENNLPCRPPLVFLIEQLVQFLTHCLHIPSVNYTVDDLHLLLAIACRLSLDPRLQELIFDIEVCISEILKCFGAAQWEEEIKELPLLLVHQSTNHRDLLHIMQVLPPTQRGYHLKQLTCAILIKFFIKEFSSETVNKDTQQRVQQFKHINKTATLRVSKLVSYLDEIQPKPSSSYYLLHTIISLVDQAVGNEDYNSSERADLKRLANKLGSLNGEIKDPRAAFLDRTKVKDLLVRTVNKLYFFIQSIEPAKERDVCEYFETNSSEYKVEVLDETTIDPRSPAYSSDASCTSSPGGSNVPSPGGSNVPSPGGSNVPSPGGSNVPSPGGSNVPSPGGSNVPSPGGSNVPSPGESIASNTDNTSDKEN